jgi:S-DNA-T family DNA segregation ATPase FtsK/SpoIIIE
VIVWGVDLKAGMELRPWAPCLHHLATTPEQAVTLLRSAVTELERRAGLLARLGGRLWEPSRDAPALVVLIDEYAELPDQAKTYADSIARRGRAVAVTLLIATQRPTQAAMGHGAIRSQMDIRICLRVRERRDTDLILGQGAHTAGWHPETLTRPGTLLISAPEHTIPRPARAYRLEDTDIPAIARRNTPHRPPGTGQHQRPASGPENAADSPTESGRMDDRPKGSAGVSGTLGAPTDNTAGPDDGAVPAEDDPHREVIDPERALWAALRKAPDPGASVEQLIGACGMSRSWVYHRLRRWADNGQVITTQPGRWRATDPTPPSAAGHTP